MKASCYVGSYPIEADVAMNRETNKNKAKQYKTEEAGQDGGGVAN